ncbi:Profilin/allergen [Dichotomopilus funicola]|uniref:Profilin n=1 Tax=Dichotomopilus funicola TaxID=1934379 RepID=A0AAN6V9G6_9PEZI|nr:Profilin/allergen [Dichotomopilus funicola]
MSWQTYVDSSLVGSGHIDKASIVSIAGDSTWATTPGFAVGADELQKVIIPILNEDEKVRDKAYGDGLYVAGERYVLTKVDGRSIYARQGKDGVCIAKTKQAIIIGHHGETIQAGNATQTVEALADYLIGQGY